MNTFWLKIAGFAVVIFVLIILISKFTGSKSEPKPEPKTFQDVAEQDKREFLTEPKSEESAEQKPQLQPTEKQVPADMDTAKQITIYCSELSDIDKIEAERLLNVAVPGRSIGTNSNSMMPPKSRSNASGVTREIPYAPSRLPASTGIRMGSAVRKPETPSARKRQADVRFVKAITTNPKMETLFLHMQGAGVSVTMKKR